jgi:hypothetical protein
VTDAKAGLYSVFDPGKWHSSHCHARRAQKTGISGGGARSEEINEIPAIDPS